MKIVCNVCKKLYEESYFPVAYNGATIPICEFCANHHYSTTKGKIRNPKKINPFLNQFLVDLKELGESTQPYFLDFNKRLQTDMEIAGQWFFEQTMERVESLLEDFPLIEYFYKDIDKIFYPTPLSQVLEKKEVMFFLGVLELPDEVYELVVKSYYLEVIMWFLGHNFSIKDRRISEEHLKKNCPDFKEYLLKIKPILLKLNPQLE